MENDANTDLQKTELAHQARERLIELKNQLGLSFVEMGARLCQFRNDKLYKELGHKTFENFLADDIDFSRTTAYNFINIYETWVVKYNLAPELVSTVPYDKLLLVSPLANKHNYTEMFNQAITLSRSDLSALKREANLPEEKKTYPAPRLKFCATCKKWIVVDQDALCTCTG